MSRIQAAIGALDDATQAVASDGRGHLRFHQHQDELMIYGNVHGLLELARALAFKANLGPGNAEVLDSNLLGMIPRGSLPQFVEIAREDNVEECVRDLAKERRSFRMVAIGFVTMLVAVQYCCWPLWAL